MQGVLGPRFRGVTGTARELHPRRPFGPVRRRVTAQVVPVRTDAGPLAGGAALLVHGRADGLTLGGGDSVRVRALGPKGPYLLERAADGAVFAAGRGWFSAW